MLTCGMQLIQGRHFAEDFGTIDHQHRYTMTTEDGPMSADFMDLSSTTVRTADPTFNPDFFTQVLSRSAGVVLLYDVTNLESFEHITNQAYKYVWICKNRKGKEDGNDRCEFILVGNKADVLEAEPEKREVESELAEQWAQSQGMKHFELTTNVRSQVEEVVQMLMNSIGRAKARAKKEYAIEGKSPHNRNKISFGKRVKQALGKRKDDA
jgi:GTPase SAR1 family protein